MCSNVLQTSLRSATLHESVPDRNGRRKQANFISFFHTVWLINSLHVAIAALRFSSPMVNRNSTPARTSALPSVARIAVLPASRNASRHEKCTMPHVQNVVLSARSPSSLAQSRREASRCSAKSASWHSATLHKDNCSFKAIEEIPRKGDFLY